VVIDLEGRRVRALATGQYVGTSPQVMTWEGRRDDGRAAPAGVYWVLLRWAGGVDRRRIVKLD
jgi:flagellar hook assembly protein FlgD